MEEAILRHFYHIQEPMGLTIKSWDGMIRCRRYLLAMEDGSAEAMAEARAERADYLRSVRGQRRASSL